MIQSYLVVFLNKKTDYFTPNLLTHGYMISLREIRKWSVTSIIQREIIFSNK